MTKNDYQKFVFDEEGQPVFQFDAMYQQCTDPWNIKDASHLQYSLVLFLLERHFTSRVIYQMLDIGSGLGAFTRRVSVRFYNSKIVGLDIAQTAVNMARESTNRMGYKNITYECRDISRMYEQIATYDVILLSQVMWYVLPTFAAIVNRLYAECLNPNGMLVINQSFPQHQKYGCEIVHCPEDLGAVIDAKPDYAIETDRGGAAYNIVLGYLKKEN